MVRQHHQLNGHEFEQTLGDNEGQGSPVLVLQSMGQSWTQLSDLTKTMNNKIVHYCTVQKSVDTWTNVCVCICINLYGPTCQVCQKVKEFRACQHYASLVYYLF